MKPYYYDDVEIDEDHAEIVFAFLLAGVMLLACLAVAALDVLAHWFGWW